MKLIRHILAFGLWLLTTKTQLQKVKKVKRNIKLVEIPNEIKQKNINLWKSIDKWHRADWLQICASINNDFDYRYISEQTYYTVVEPKLNNAAFSEAYEDKNFYSKIIDNSLLPETLIRCINGVYYDNEYRFIENPMEAIRDITKKQNKLVCKIAVDSQGGKGVEVFTKDKNGFEFLESAIHNPNILRNHFGENFIIQKYIFQHSFFEQFNTSSVNTIRIFTYRSVTNNQVHVLHSLFRMGKMGSNVDNMNAGGISCGIDINTAKLNDFALDKFGSKVWSYNEVDFKEKYIPAFEEMKIQAQLIGQKYQYHRLLGFDFCLDINNEVKLIELNNKGIGISAHQMHMGPLFKNHFEEIIKFCIDNKKTLNLDFEV